MEYLSGVKALIFLHRNGTDIIIFVVSAQGRIPIRRKIPRGTNGILKDVMIGNHKVTRSNTVSALRRSHECKWIGLGGKVSG